MARTPYEKTTWIDRDNVTNTPGTKLNAQNFNKLEQGLETTDASVVTLEETVAALQLTIGAIGTLQTSYDELKAKFDAHVHENDAGTTTGPVVIPTP